MTVRCDKYPQLRVHDLGICFVGGIAVVTDAAKLEALRDMTGYGFIFEDAEPVVSSKGRKAREGGDGNASGSGD